MKYNIYRQSEVLGEMIKFAEFEPAANDKGCNFGGMKFWSKDEGFVSGAFKLDEYWVVSEDDIEFVPHQSY